MANFYMSNVTGILDVEAIVKSLTSNTQKQIQKFAQERALLQAQSSSLTNISSAIKDLQSFNSSLKIEDLFKGKGASVSDPSVLRAEVNESAPNINLSVKVLSLSLGEVRTSSGGVSSLNTALSSATFTLKYWTDNSNFNETTINFGGGTLEDLVKTINQSQNKVVASVYFDGNSYKLMLSEKDVGASTRETDTNNGIYVMEISQGNLPTELGGLSGALQNAQNARLQIGSNSGPEIVSATNTFREVVTGLNLTALKTSDNFVQVNIKDSYDKASQAISNLFSKINSVLDLVNQVTGQRGLFQGNQTITQIKSRLFTLTKPLQELGLVNITDEGKYTSNISNFDALVQQGQIDKIKNALSQTNTNLKTYLEGLTNTLQKYQQTQDSKIKALDLKVQTIQRNLTKEEEKLRLTFSKIEAIMYQNEQLRTRLENFAVSLSEAIKKG